MNKETKFLDFMIIIPLSLFFLLSIFIITGYSSKAFASASVSGASLFKSEGCIACHIINGKGGKVGPNLSHIGSNNLSYHWMKKQLIDPAAHFRSNIMPSFGNIPPAKIKILVSYLESLK
jgi:cytochrome c551/c552